MTPPNGLATKAIMRMRKQRKQQEDWTRGLKTRTANALRAYGFQSRDEVAAFPIDQFMRIEHFGEASLADLSTWLSFDEYGESAQESRPAPPLADRKSSPKIAAQAKLRR